jgi:NAD(P)H-hydrate epimerase
MQKVLTAEEMREVDRQTVEKYGIPFIILMENAARAAARVIAEKLGGSVAGKSFLILCGKGNNGGDGAALARILRLQGAKVFVNLLGKIDDTKDEAKINFEILRRQGSVDYYQWNSFEFEEFTDFDKWKQVFKMYFRTERVECVVDALFGTGLTRPLESISANIVDFFIDLKQNKNDSLLFVSLDLPSGLNSNLAKQIGTNFSSDLTITFTAPKQANILAPASHFNGELVTVNIGSPEELIEDTASQLFLAEKQDAQNWLESTKFTANSYKKTRGHVFVIAGSKDMSGAAALCANAAMTSGIGLVTAVTPESARSAVAAHALPEIMVSGAPQTQNGAFSEIALETVLKLSDKTDVAVIGCGLSSNEESTRQFVRNFIENCKTPVVIDADGLNALAPFALTGNDELPLILTPHIGEMRRLLGVDENLDLSDRVQIAREFAQKHHVILVLKGERTLIAEPGGKVIVNPTGNAGIGKGGNGDTLAGIIAGFIAQTLAAPQNFSFYTPSSTSWKIQATFEAVIAALYVAGLAGDIAAKKIGMRAMIASDVRECLIEAFRELES